MVVLDNKPKKIDNKSYIIILYTIEIHNPPFKKMSNLMIQVHKFKVINSRH